MKQHYTTPIYSLEFENGARANEIDEQLLEIYWYKKQLDEFLPKIATYSTPEEVSAITLSQLNAIETKVLHLLHNLSEKAV